jgi:hypothetical protein
LEKEDADVSMSTSDSDAVDPAVEAKSEFAESDVVSARLAPLNACC